MSENGAYNDDNISTKNVLLPEISETPWHLASSSTNDVDYSLHTKTEMHTASAKTAPKQREYAQESDNDNKVQTEGILSVQQQREDIQRHEEEDDANVLSSKSDEYIVTPDKIFTESTITLEGPLGKFLHVLDFSSIMREKCGQYMEGSRHWLFDAFRDWNRKSIKPDDSKRKLFWLMGTGGTGKSVISAELLRRGLASPEEFGCSFLAWYNNNSNSYCFSRMLV